jgi:hypothetical protein
MTHRLPVLILFYGFGVMLSLSISSCSTNSLLSPYPLQENQMKDTLESVIHIPQSDIVLSFEISKHSIVDSFGVIIDSILSEPFTFPEQNLQVQLTRFDQGTMFTQGKRLLATIPMNIKVTKKSFIGEMEAFGKANITFLSDIEIDATWNMTTHTIMEDYTWVEKPKFKMGFITLPIQWISDEIVRRFKTQIVQSIDEGISQNFNLSQEMSEITTNLFQPYQLDSTAGGWIQMSADSVHLAPVIDNELYTISRLYAPVHMVVKSRASMYTQEIKTPLPPFSWKENISDTSLFRLWIDLDYDYLTQIARANFVNQTFKNGDKEVKVENLWITGDDNRLIVRCLTTGSFKGEITIAGTPIYENGILTAKNLEWNISTGNLLHKAASWLGKGYIHDQLNTMLTFKINDYVDRAKAEISNKLNQLKNDRQITIDIQWGQFEIDQLNTQRAGLKGLMEVALRIHIIIDDLRKLSIEKG